MLTALKTHLFFHLIVEICPFFFIYKKRKGINLSFAPELSEFDEDSMKICVMVKGKSSTAAF